MNFNELIKQTRGRRSLLQALGAAAVGISFGGLAACSKEGGKTLAKGEEAKLNFYNWYTYLGENRLDTFKETTGVDVKMHVSDRHAVRFATIKAGHHDQAWIV